MAIFLKLKFTESIKKTKFHFQEALSPKSQKQKALPSNKTNKRLKDKTYQELESMYSRGHEFLLLD